MKYIALIEKNYMNNIIIFGTIGKRVYCQYSKKEAIKLYNKECKKELKK